MRNKRVAIVTIANDLHALAIQKSLERYEDVFCEIVESDSICGGENLNWSNAGPGEPNSTVPIQDGVVGVDEIDVIWWRRVNAPQQVPDEITQASYIDLINNDCRTALWGTLLNGFTGTWISEPNATTLAENKLIQLQVAQRVGLRVPRTLVSNNPVRIRSFCAALGGKVVVKPIKGTRQAPVLTNMLTDTHLASEASLRLSPAIYQEYIEGNRHLRVSVFGDEVYSALIQTDDLDWRRNLDIPVQEYELPEETQHHLRAVLRALGLRMGIFDLKLDKDDVPVWLEVNPQGQFLFIEGLSGMDLTYRFAEFLCREARRTGSEHPTAL